MHWMHSFLDMFPKHNNMNKSADSSEIVHLNSEYELDYILLSTEKLYFSAYARKNLNELVRKKMFQY